LRIEIYHQLICLTLQLLNGAPISDSYAQDPDFVELEYDKNIEMLFNLTYPYYKKTALFMLLLNCDTLIMNKLDVSIDYTLTEAILGIFRLFVF